MEKSKVYFTKEIKPESLIKLYEKVGVELSGKIAVKLHSGEKGNQNYLRPEFLKDIIEKVNGTVVECNTAYEGARNTTARHIELMDTHGWSKYFNIDILDSEGEEKLQNPNGEIIKINYIGSHMKNYDSMLVLSHFKGHPMGGFGGAIKNISIGLASSNGKLHIHTSGKGGSMFEANQNDFLKSMADSAKTIDEY